MYLHKFIQDHPKIEIDFSFLFQFENTPFPELKKITYIYPQNLEKKVEKKLEIDDNSLQIEIRGKEYIFNKIDFRFGSTSNYYQYNQQYFLKFPKNNIEHGVLEREVFILNRLKDYNHFPKIIKSTKEYIVLTHCGERLNRKNIPKDILGQIEEICIILKKEEVNHTDIKDEELLIKDGILYLVDFGWAKYRGEYSCGLNISNISLADNKFYNDKACMIDIVERIRDPSLFYHKNKLLKNNKNKKWLGIE